MRFLMSLACQKGYILSQADITGAYLESHLTETVFMEPPPDLFDSHGEPPRNSQGREQKVPLFGDIPLIGNLFKTRSSSKQKTNLMIFIRPKILVNSEQMATETDAKYNYIRSLQLQYGASVPLQPREHQAVLPELQSLEPTTKTSATETPKARAMRGAAESANRGNAATPADTSAAPNSPSAPSGEDSTP